MKAPFKCISLYRGKLNIDQCLNGIHEYVPIIFDEEHFNMVNCTFHANIMDFCYRKPMLTSE